MVEESVQLLVLSFFSSSSSSPSYSSYSSISSTLSLSFLDYDFTRMFVENRIIAIEKSFDLLRRVQHDRIHVDIPVLRIVDRVVQSLVLAGDHSARFQLHACSQLGMNGVELVVDKQIHLRDQQLRSFFNHCRRGDRMNRQRRRQRVHLLQQTQQIAFFQQCIQLEISKQ